MAARHQHHGPAAKQLAQPLNDRVIHRQRRRIALGGAHRHHPVGPQAAKALGVLLGLGKTALTAAKQPGRIPAQPQMPLKRGSAHAGIDQVQAGHGLHDFGPELRLRQHPQIGAPMGAKSPPTQPMIDRHRLMNHPGGKHRGSQAGGAAAHRGEQHRGAASGRLQGREHRQQAMEFAHTGGVEPQQGAHRPGARGPAQPLLNPPGILLALQQTQGQQQQRHRREQEPQQPIEQQQTHG